MGTDRPEEAVRLKGDMMKREEHPDPQFRRSSYECLNGRWEFEWGCGEDKTNSPLALSIEVPFCPESPLSGLGGRARSSDCVYSRTITLSEEDLKSRLVVHFGAVDRVARVYCNGVAVASHTGGYTPFEAELNGAARAGENRLTVLVHDDTRDDAPSGKQSPKESSFGCFYTRVTGIWQTVWLERTPFAYIRSFRLIPDAARGVLRARVFCTGEGTVRLEAFYEGRSVGSAEGKNGQFLELALSERHLWEPGKGRLYDLKITFGEDEVTSYFGLRDVGYKGKRFLVNGRSVFQRFVLDQGYFPEGIYTAPDAALFREDIGRAQALGFNGARLHQKVFEPRYLYECDRAGFLVWGEYASWGIGYGNVSGLTMFLNEWTEAVERDINHPCIVTWCPLNETWESLEDGKTLRDIRFVDAVYEVTKRLDPTRPCVDVSGGYHGTRTDLADFHCYAGYDVLKAHLAATAAGRPDFPKMYLDGEGTGYRGEPLALSEFGGISFGGTKVEPSCCVLERDAWGYDSVRDEDAFLADYERTIALLLSFRELSGFCYTQLYDVEQEQNGIYTYERQPKFREDEMERIRRVNCAEAAIERETSEENGA